MNILILEPNKTSYSTIVKTLRERFGMSIDINEAKDVGNLMFQVKKKVYDIIVSEYNTGELRNGQQILEEIRINQLIPWTTCYVIITTSEEKKKEIEKVILTGEYYPDEYILKPFTENIVGERLEDTIKKKKFLADIYKAMNKNKYEVAIHICDKLLGTKNEYKRDIVRLKLVCLLKLNDFETIKKIYREMQKDIEYKNIIETGRFKFAYANALFSLGNYEEAEVISLDIKKQYPKYLDNFKLLADILHAERKDKEAIAVLKEALELSPLNIEKQQILGKISLFSGDLETSKVAFKTVVEKGKGSPRYGIEDHANLSNIHGQLGEYDEAMKVIGEGYESFKDTPEAKFITSVMESQILAKKGDISGSKSAFALALSEFKGNPVLKLSHNMQLYFGAECLENGEKELGKKMINSGIEGFSRKDTIKAHLSKVLRGEESVSMLEKIIENEGNKGKTPFQKASDLITGGDWKGAISILTQQIYDEPKNPHAYFSLAKVKIRYMIKNISLLARSDHEFDAQLFDVKSLIDRGEKQILSDSKDKYSGDQKTIGLMINDLNSKINLEKERLKKVTPDMLTGNQELDDILPDIVLGGK